MIKKLITLLTFQKTHEAFNTGKERRYINCAPWKEIDDVIIPIFDTRENDPIDNVHKRLEQSKL